MLMTRLTILNFFIFIFYTSTAFASEKCQCPPAKDLASELQASSIAFVGQVVETRHKFSLHPGYYYIRFMPLKKYKGFDVYPNEDNIIIYAPVSDNSCTVPFIRGNDYLVFAKGNPAFLKTTACDLTGLQEDKGSLIIALDKDKKK